MNFRLLVLGLTTTCLLQTGFSAEKEQVRGLWVDAWHGGFKSEAEIQKLVSDARAANFNAIFAQVRRRGDAFYKSEIVPRPNDTNVIPSDFDCLGELLKAAHDTTKGPKLEVHAWLVMYTASGFTRPSDPKHVLNAHPDWLSETDLNAQFDGVDRGYWLDPGHPKVQAHLYDVVLELANNYPVDGICFDYLRYPGNEWGYNKTAVERFMYLHGRKTTPKRMDPEWTQFRRDQVTALLRKIYLGMAETHSKVTVSAVGMTFSPAIGPETPWTMTGPYVRALQDWKAWAAEGIVDMSIPLVFFKSDNPERLQSFANWSQFAKDNSGPRLMAISTGNYYNSLENGLTQVNSCLEPSLSGNNFHGVLWYSYYKPTSEKTPWSQIASALSASQGGPFGKAVGFPKMPWKSAPTKGHLKGFARSSQSNAALDGATVILSGPEQRKAITDASGFYGFVDLAPGEYSIVCEANGFNAATNTFTVVSGKPNSLVLFPTPKD